MQLILTKEKGYSAGHTNLTRSCGFGTLYFKELADHFHSVRFKLLFALLVLSSLVALITAKNAASEAAASSEYRFLLLFTSAGSSLPSVASLLAYLAPLAGLALGFDAINRERNQGTLNHLVSQPIYRDAVINAKFLAGVTVIFIITAFLNTVILGIGLLTFGCFPATEEILRVITYMLFTVVYTSLWLSISQLFSTICKHAATSALIMIAIWIFLSLFYTMIVKMVSNAMYPLEGIEGYYNMYGNYSFQLHASRLSPYYLYCEAVTTLLNPNIRTIGITTQASYSGALASYLSFDQSLLLICPHLVSMLASVMAAFTISYISFMRSEIRA